MNLITLNPGSGMTELKLRLAYFEAIVKDRQMVDLDESLLNTMFKDCLKWHLEEEKIAINEEGLYYNPNYGKYPIR